MKRFFRMMMLIVAATMAFAACSQYEDENIAGPTVKVNVSMVLDATRSSFGEPDGKIYPTSWDGNEEMKYSLNFGDASNVEPTFVDDQSATAELTLTDDGSGSYTIHALSPASAYLSVFASDKKWNVTVPATQTPSATSCDPAAQILYGVSNTSDVLDGSYTLSFHHALAYGKMTLENLALNGAKISSVAITTDSDIAGRHYVYPLEKGKTTVNSGAKSITIITDTDENIWFACAPVAFNSLKVTVTTDKGVFTKQISASKTFKAGKIAVFAIDMAGVVAEKPAEYQLLTDVADLNIGDYVILANTENAAAMSSTQNGNNRSKDAVTIENGCIVAPGDGVEIFVVEEGTKDNTYAFLATKTEGYIYAASSSSNHLKTEQTLSDNSSFAITISNGTTSIIAQGSNTRNVMQYNPSSNGGLFACYGSASQKPVDIYYLPSGNAPATPSIKASDIEGVPAEGVTNATATVSVKNIDGNVTVTKDGTVVTAASLSGNTLTYTVSANTGDAREGWIKLAATGAECTIKVSQLGVASTHSLPYEESFGSNQGEFTIEDVNISSLSYVWQWASGYGMKASAYVSGTKHVTESWLVSPKISLEGATDPELTFDHVQRYAGTASTELTVWVSANNGAWEQVTVPTYSTGNDWTFVNSGKISLSKYIGSVVKIGFKYTSSASAAATWEIKNFSVVDNNSETPAPVQLTMSDITCSAKTENSLTFSWEAVANATGYQVSTDGGSTYGATQTETTYTWSGLMTSTTKTIYVKAIGNGSTYTDSAAKSASGTTSAAQGGGEGGSTGTAKFVKVTSAPSDWSGTYLIVYEAGNLAFDGSRTTLDASGNSKSVTIANNEIEATDAMKAIAFTIAKDGSNYTVKSASGYYIGQTSDANGLKSSTTTTYNHTLSMTGSDANLVSGGAYLRYNAATGDTNLRFRYYKSSSYTNQKTIQLYRLTDGESGGNTPVEPETPATPTQLATPSVTASVSGNTVTVSWNAITGAKDYTVKCGSSTQTVTTTSASFSGLTYSTKYDVSVVAHPSDTTANTDSEAGTAIVTTGADPNAGGSGEKKTYTLTITKENFNSASYSANNGDHTTTATAADGSTMQVTWVSNQVMNQNSTMQWQKNTGYIYNSTDLGTITDVTIDSTGGTFTTYKGSSAQPTSNGAGGYFQIKVGNATGKVNSITVTFEK